MASHPYTAFRAALEAAAFAFVAAGNRAEYKDRRAFRSREKQLRGKAEWWIEQMEVRLEEDWWRTWTLAEQNHALLADLARVKGQYEHSTLANPGLERMPNPLGDIASPTLHRMVRSFNRVLYLIHQLGLALTARGAPANTATEWFRRGVLTRLTPEDFARESEIHRGGVVKEFSSVLEAVKEGRMRELPALDDERHFAGLQAMLWRIEQQHAQSADHEAARLLLGLPGGLPGAQGGQTERSLARGRVRLGLRQGWIYGRAWAGV